jgi:2-iminobutanoate/2-iminopropanoate deaminase
MSVNSSLNPVTSTRSSQNRAMKEIISSPQVPKPAGPYSPGIRANGLVFISGQIPVDPQTGELVGGSIQEQTARVLENLKTVLQAAGLSLDDVVKTTVFLQNLSDFGQMNEVYAKYFSANPPARSTIEVSRLPRDCKIEVEAIALERTA